MAIRIIQTMKTGQSLKTQDGFTIKALSDGSGPLCPEGARVKAHYTGKFLDGRVFDTSIGKQPFEFTCGEQRVIRAWDEGFTRLRKGQRAVMTCPPQWAYGHAGAGDDIPPDSTLVFEVELVEYTIDHTSKKFAEGEEEKVLDECWDFTVSDSHKFSPQAVQAIRLIMFVTTFSLFLFALYIFKWTSQLYFFTQIGNNICWLSAGLQFYQGMRNNQAPFFKLTCVLTQYAFTFQIIITVVYWIALHAHMKQMIENVDNKELIYWFMVLVHSWPLVSSTSLTLLTKGYFFHQHGDYLLWFGPLYLGLNAVGCWERGYALYPFMPWMTNPFRSAFTGIALFIGGLLLFKGACTQVNKRLKQKHIPRAWVQEEEETKKD
ncbi:hypothetical protein FGO68_gene14940 [Halteria grandinella]|uniref:peptidylprolyl isomerase n=1 Tax=Halteria grandinella TaxID=5974 RepID=A0A8J8NLH7_HALGN|nr:hypothetical protein FGO68_gene14940 [Halteria grandinella]